MIAYIKGIVASIQDDSVIVDVQGIGYEIICANPFVFESSLNEEVTIQTYHHVREDLQVLYGFKTIDEKSLFMKLISVSGMGPKGALAILANVNVEEFVAAIEREDDKYLTSFPGVGKKTSRQMILDLKGKLTTLFSMSKPEIEHVTEVTGGKELQEAQEALKALGYTEREIRGIQPQLQKENLTQTDEIIRRGLALLVKH